MPEKIHIDTIETGKMKVKVINHHPEVDAKTKRDIERRLFEVFKKYEKQD